MSRTDKEIIDEALFHLIYVEKYAQENLNDSVYLDAISMRLSSAIDTLNRLPDSLKKELFGKTGTICGECETGLLTVMR